MESKARVMACNGTSIELQNRVVVASLFKSLLPNGVGEANGLHSLVRESATSAQLSSEERRTVETVADQMTLVIHNTPSIAMEREIRDFKVAGWDVNGDNMEDEFREVERKTFSDDVNWGRVIAFLSFSVAFAAYVSSRGISGGAESVFEWTNQVLNRPLRDFMKKEDGWRGFTKYADTLLRAQERRRQSENQTDQTDQPLQQSASHWDSVAAYGASLGALGVGALLAIGVRQAFS